MSVTDSLKVAERLLEIPRSEWWSESSTHWVDENTYINNVVGLVDQDTWFSALVEVCDQFPDETWRYWLVVEWDSYRENPLFAWWLGDSDIGNWRFFDEESLTGETKSTVFLKWANMVSSLNKKENSNNA